MLRVWGKNKYYFMLAPIVAWICLFRAYPIGASIWISLTEWTIVGKSTFVGLANYQELLTADPLFWISVYHNLFYTTVILFVAIPLSLVIATGLNAIIHRGIRAVVSALYFFSYVVPAVVVGVIWFVLFNPTLGIINFVLECFHLPPQPWLSSPDQAMTAISITGVWRLLGFNAVVYLAALQGIPTQFYEAAEVDGSTNWKNFFHITIPLLQPVTLFLLVMNTIWAFQLFDVVYVMTSTSGGPGDATYTLAFYLWRKGFLYFQMGYAAAMGLMMFCFIFGASIIQFRLGKQRWKY